MLCCAVLRLLNSPPSHAGEWRKHETQPRFVTLVVRPRPGQGGYTVDTVEGLGQETYQEWQPGGVDLDIVVAAVSVRTPPRHAHPSRQPFTLLPAAAGASRR